MANRNNNNNYDDDQQSVPDNSNINNSDNIPRLMNYRTSDEEYNLAFLAYFLLGKYYHVLVNNIRIQDLTEDQSLSTCKSGYLHFVLAKEKKKKRKLDNVTGNWKQNGEEKHLKTNYTDEYKLNVTNEASQKLLELVEGIRCSKRTLTFQKNGGHFKLWEYSIQLDPIVSGGNELLFRHYLEDDEGMATSIKYNIDKMNVKLSLKTDSSITYELSTLSSLKGEFIRVYNLYKSDFETLYKAQPAEQEPIEELKQHLTSTLPQNNQQQYHKQQKQQKQQRQKQLLQQQQQQQQYQQQQQQYQYQQQYQPNSLKIGNPANLGYVSPACIVPIQPSYLSFSSYSPSSGKSTASNSLNSSTNCSPILFSEPLSDQNTPNFDSCVPEKSSPLSVLFEFASFKTQKKRTKLNSSDGEIDYCAKKNNNNNNINNNNNNTHIVPTYIKSYNTPKTNINFLVNN